MSDKHADAVEQALAKLAEQNGTPPDLLPPAGMSAEWLREYERPAREAYERALTHSVPQLERAAADLRRDARLGWGGTAGSERWGDEMSADAIFALLYGVLTATWITSAVGRGGWQAIPTTMGRDIGAVLALFNAIARAMADALDQIADGIRETSSPHHAVTATGDPRVAPHLAAYLRDEIDLEEYEHRVWRILHGAPAVATVPSEADVALVKPIRAHHAAGLSDSISSTALR